MTFVYKQTAVLTDLNTFLSINTLPHTSVSLASCISIVFSVLNILTNLITLPGVGSL